MYHLSWEEDSKEQRLPSPEIEEPGFLPPGSALAEEHGILFAGLCCCLFVFQAGRLATHHSKEWLRRKT